MKQLILALYDLFIKKVDDGYVWLCYKTLPRNCDHHTLIWRIQSHKKLFGVLANIVRLRPVPTMFDQMLETQRWADIKNRLREKYHNDSERARRVT